MAGGHSVRSFVVERQAGSAPSHRSDVDSLVCSNCGFTARNASGLSRHVNSKHGHQQVSFVCVSTVAWSVDRSVPLHVTSRSMRSQQRQHRGPVRVLDVDNFSGGRPLQQTCSGAMSAAGRASRCRRLQRKRAVEVPRMLAHLRAPHGLQQALAALPRPT